MTAPDYVAQVAELLGQHAPDGTMNRLWCRCGWEADRTINGPLRRQHTAHQAEVLAAAGLIPTSTAQTYLNGRVVERGVTDWKDATDD